MHILKPRAVLLITISLFVIAPALHAQKSSGKKGSTSKNQPSVKVQPASKSSQEQDGLLSTHMRPQRVLTLEMLKAVEADEKYMALVKEKEGIYYDYNAPSTMMEELKLAIKERNAERTPYELLFANFNIGKIDIDYLDKYHTMWQSAIMEAIQADDALLEILGHQFKEVLYNDEAFKALLLKKCEDQYRK